MNLSTFIVGLIVFLVFFAIVAHEVRNRRNGKSGCSCGCENCGGSALCHPQKKKTNTGG
ncbi:MAG: FeoB-associated Cys-rich membrane protein [Stomatobaculum sp.]|nr:FeoB-associated Cys-rich membrane protein [Stomatobaculum sp.]